MESHADSLPHGDNALATKIATHVTAATPTPQSPLPSELNPDIPTSITNGSGQIVTSDPEPSLDLSHSQNHDAFASNQAVLDPIDSGDSAPIAASGTNALASTPAPETSNVNIDNDAAMTSNDSVADAPVSVLNPPATDSVPTAQAPTDVASDTFDASKTAERPEPLPTPPEAESVHAAHPTQGTLAPHDPASSFSNAEDTQTSTIASSQPNGNTADIHSAGVSKLAIDESPSDFAVRDGTLDASMVDAPLSTTGKIGREREDDGDELPAAKRARTAEEESKPGESTIVAAPTEANADAMDIDSASASEPVALSVDGKVRRLNDLALSPNPMTEHQNKEFRKVLAAVKKTKAGGGFRLPVESLWPAVWPQYREKVAQPMDISVIEQKLRDNGYATIGDFRKDVALIHTNSVVFNGAQHDVTQKAKDTVENIAQRLSDIPAEPQTRADARLEGKATTTRHVEPRAAASPAQSASVLPPPPPPPPQRKASKTATTTTTAADSVFAVPSSGVPTVRRNSTFTDGDRPKRPIHPPKNKDFGFQANNKRKITLDFRFAELAMDELKKAKYASYAAAFMDPVDPVALNIPNYFSIIRHPMDLGTIDSKLKHGEYDTVKQFESDVRLVFKNCYKFNPASHLVHTNGKYMEKVFNDKWAEKDDWVAKHAPTGSAATSPRRAVKDESDEEEDAAEEEDDELSKALSMLEHLVARWKLETDAAGKLMVSSNPDQKMITTHNDFASMLQAQVMEQRTKITELEKKKSMATKPKPKKKANGNNKKPSTAANKKTGGTASSNKKATKARTLSAVEKQMVSDGIGTLDGPLLDKAIDIIKKDTNMTETEDQELELDMELLSAAALLKLFEIIVKADPKMAARAAQEAPESVHIPTAKAGSKPKKNKPMSKSEQETKMRHLEELKSTYNPNRSSGSQDPLPSVEDGGPGTPHEESDDDSDSEEE